jgi:hypothetical protein
MEDEATYPKQYRSHVLSGAEETWMGFRDGARRQYRRGNEHIREYDDRFVVHTDRIDPRSNPLGHLLYDAPEVLAGLAGAVIGGVAAYRGMGKPAGIAAALATGYLSYHIAKSVKKALGG